MINLFEENVVSLDEATNICRHLTGRKNLHPATLYRYSRDGFRGVRLETIQVGGTLCTSKQALQRFCERVTKCSSPKAPNCGAEKDSNV